MEEHYTEHCSPDVPFRLIAAQQCFRSKRCHCLSPESHHQSFSFDPIWWSKPHLNCDHSLPVRGVVFELHFTLSESFCLPDLAKVLESHFFSKRSGSNFVGLKAYCIIDFFVYSFT